MVKLSSLTGMDIAISDEHVLKFRYDICGILFVHDLANQKYEQVHVICK